MARSGAGRDPFGPTREQRRAAREIERKNYRDLSRILRVRDGAGDARRGRRRRL